MIPMVFVPWIPWTCIGQSKGSARHAPLLASNFFHFHVVFGKNHAKQESIPVGRVLPTRPLEGLWLWRGYGLRGMVLGDYGPGGGRYGPRGYGPTPPSTCGQNYTLHSHNFVGGR